MSKKLSVLLASFFALVSPALQAKELALIIGIDLYSHIVDLERPIEDANAYSDLFRANGYDVYLFTNLSNQQFNTELGRFYDRIEPGDTVVFVYAGHGFGVGSNSYLVPSDTPSDDSINVLQSLTIPLQNYQTGILDKIAEQGAGLTIAIIDACRDFPFKSTQATRSMGTLRGLAEIKPPAQGTFVIYSAGAGQKAQDNLGPNDPLPNSLFTRFFLANLRETGDIREAAFLTRDQVYSVARDLGFDQFPATYDQLTGGTTCLFASCNETPTEIPVSIEVTQPFAAISVDEIWNTLRGSNNLAALEDFIETYDSSEPMFAEMARQRISKLSVEDIQPIFIEPVLMEPNTNEGFEINSLDTTEPSEEQIYSSNPAFENWSVFFPTDPDGCFATATPKQSNALKGGVQISVRRGDVQLFVNREPINRIFNEISFMAGYPIRDGSATLRIGFEEFRLTSQDEIAWTRPADDAAILAALQTNEVAIVEATSIRGTQTLDEFSLSGFGAALANIETKCPN